MVQGWKKAKFSNRIISVWILLVLVVKTISKRFRTIKERGPRCNGLHLHSFICQSLNSGSVEIQILLPKSRMFAMVNALSINHSSYAIHNHHHHHYSHHHTKRKTLTHASARRFFAIANILLLEGKMGTKLCP